MNCKIYRSDTKPGLYIYLAKAKDITDLPKDLIKLLGTHTKVMELDLSSRQTLANENIHKVKDNLTEQGYHVQLPHNLVKNVLSYSSPLF
ncbi:hypothetical protein MNBD_GAMMA01-1711 [hydrothermal vent metagenome]|uniref:YcgL domain-containing protein n=1 Tax=hydrothermal vent metagenome TaxID=652676 RepID=A0A3B0VD56_9ZZZZ